MRCFHDCYHCANVRTYSLKTRYGGHGLLYSFVAAMLATFASTILSVVWSLKVPTLEDVLSQRLLDACACWLLVNLTPTRIISSLYGKGRDGALMRRALFSGEALNKFVGLTRGVLKSQPQGTLERLSFVASSSSASTLSRALTDGCVVSDNPRWLINAVYSTAKELRRCLALVTVVYIAHGEFFSRVVKYLHCDADVDFTGDWVSGLVKRSSCVAPEDHGRVVELGRQSVITLIFIYLLNVFFDKAATPTPFKAKPKTKKILAAAKAQQRAPAPTETNQGKIANKREKTKTE